MGLSNGSLHGHGIDRGEILGGDLLVDEAQGGKGAEKGQEVGEDRVIPKAGILFQEHGGDRVGKQCGVEDVALRIRETRGTDRDLVGVRHDDLFY
jgi:hypothetical protein